MLSHRASTSIRGASISQEEIMDNHEESNSKKEAFESKIRPALMRLAKMCSKADIEFVAKASWGDDGGERESVFVLDKRPSKSMEIMRIASKSDGDIDATIYELKNFSRDPRRG
jgi:hypothetical protein